MTNRNQTLADNEYEI